MTTAVTPEPWRRDAIEVAAELGTDIRRGPTSTEAVVRLARHSPNQLDYSALVPPLKQADSGVCLPARCLSPTMPRAVSELARILGALGGHHAIDNRHD